MSIFLHVVLRKALPSTCLLALTSVLTGCGPEHGQRLFPFDHNASLSESGQLIADPPADFRHHPHATRVSQSQPHHRTHL